MKQEAGWLLREADQNQGQIAPGMPVRLSNGTLLVISGIGAVRARLAAEELVKAGATSLASWGTAGALVPDLSAGSLVVPQRVLLPGHGAFSADAAWHKRLCAKLSGHVDLHTRSLLQSDRVLRNPYAKESFSEKYGGIAVDMESAAVAEAALSANIPFVAIRAVSDSINMNIPASALTAVDEMGRLRPLRMLKALVRYPQETFQLIQLGRGIHAALKALKTVFTLTGHGLLAP
jgi:adenosylhomocysteine nucleosidase